MICEYCGISLKSLGKKAVEHVNVSQPKKIHSFCSQSCKDNWCLQLQKNKSRLLVTWCIGAYIGRYFFVKKLMRVRSPSKLGTESNKSYFKANIQEVERLEIVEFNGRKVLKVKP
jgi:hypothetical protein